MTILLKTPTIAKDGFELTRFSSLQNPGFQFRARAVYENLTKGENAKNELKRGIAWGVFAKGEFTWLERNTYWLPAKLNAEEAGAVRLFTKLPEYFLKDSAVEEALREAFEIWDFPDKSTHRAYEVQLAAIRYEPTVDRPALPSPLIPHQDMIDGTIVVLNKTKHLIGGISRLYDLNGEPLYELDLDVGEGLSVKDSELLHQVSVMDVEPGPGWRLGDRVFRDVLLIRFQKLGR